MNAKVVSKEPDGSKEMEIIIAAAAFVGLFGMWVVLPRKFLHK